MMMASSPCSTSTPALLASERIVQSPLLGEQSLVRQVYVRVTGDITWSSVCDDRLPSDARHEP